MSRPACPMIAARDKRIACLYRDGAYAAELAARYSLSKRQIGRIIKRAGVQKHPRFLPGRKPGRNVDMAKAYVKGETLVSIGQRYGIAPATVWHTMKRLGVLLPKEEVQRRRAGKGRSRLPVSDADRRLYEKMRRVLGAKAARAEMGIAA